MEVKLGGAEEHFAKKLANNDKKIRDRALKRLQIWVASRPSASSGFTEIELLKIWKGLFYCFWMSDKPLIQEELAGNISELLHSFKNIDSGYTFISSFFKTFHREWHGIDRLRLDKFYMLIRFFIRGNFELLKRNNWESSLCKRLASVYQDGPLNSTSESVPVGIQLHLSSIFLSELQSIKCSEIPSEAVIMLLEPFFILAAQTKSQVVLRAVKDGILEKISEIESRKSPEESEENSDDNSEMGGKVPFMINVQQITERLLNLASNRDILSRNRNMLYLYAKKFKKQHPGTTENGDCIFGKRKAKNGEGNDDDMKKTKGKKHKKIKTAKKENELNNNEVPSLNGVEEKEEKHTKREKSKKTSEEKDNQQCCHSNSRSTEVIAAKIQENTSNEHEVDVRKRKKLKMKKSGPLLDEQNVNEEEGGDVATKKRKNTKKSKPDENQNESLSLNGTIMPSEAESTKSKNQKTKHDNTEDNEHFNSTLLEKDVNDKEKTNGFTPKKNKKQKKRKAADTQEQNTDTELNVNRNEHNVNKNNEQMNHSQDDKDDVASDDKLDKALKEMREKISNSASTPKVKRTPQRNAKSMTPHAFATFTKTKTPPAFVKKSKPQTEPRKMIKTQLSTPKSAPPKKKVTIQLSKNVTQTPLEYVKTLKTSPSIPFDANVSPAFGLLKRKTRSMSKSTKLTPMKRSKAVDFF